MLSRRWTPSVLIALVTAFVWGHTVTYEFVWDDRDLIQRVKSIRSFRNLPAMFHSLDAQSAWPEGFVLFRPVRLVACTVLVKLGGRDVPQPWIFHLANVIGHGLAALLLFAVAEKLFAKWFPDRAPPRTRMFALWVALAYAAHPVVSEVVCWAKALDDELATVFALASALCLLKWNEEKQPVAGALAFYTLAVYSKISAVPFALVALLLVRQVHGMSWRMAASKTWGFFLVTLVFMAHRHLVIGRSSQTSPISGSYGQTLIDMLPVVPQYVRLMLGMPPFLIDYTYQKGGHAFLSLPVQTGLWLLVAFVALTFWSLRSARWRFIGFGFLWAGLFLLPVSNLLPMMQYMAERFLYLPLIGWLLVLGGLLLTIRRWQFSAPVSVALACFWMVTARDRSFIWRDNLTLFVQSSQQGIRIQRVEENAVGAIFGQPQVFSIFRFSNHARDLEIVKVPSAEERVPLRQTLEAAQQLFPDNPTVATALGHLEEWDGHPERAREYRESAGAARRPPAPRLAEQSVK